MNNLFYLRTTFVTAKMHDEVKSVSVLNNIERNPTVLVGVDQSFFCFVFVVAKKPARRAQRRFEVLVLRHLVLLGVVGAAVEIEDRDTDHLGAGEHDRLVHQLAVVLSDAVLEGARGARGWAVGGEVDAAAALEAAAAAVPVVATPVGGVPELVVHGETGRLAEDAVGLGLSLVELARHEHLRRSMGLAARGRVRVRHSGAALADRLEDVYSSVREELQCAS